MSNELNLLDERSIGFQIAPRLNAAGRLNHASTAYELLVTEDDKRAEELAQEINATNQERQRITETITKSALAEIGEPGNKKLLAVVGQGWPTGVVGLVSGRISDQFYRPSMVMSRFRDEIIGSGRSTEHFNIIEALQKCGEFLKKYGGHAQACGFTVKDEASLQPFLDRMLQLAEESISDEQLAKPLPIDADVQLEDITWEFFSELEQFAPYGKNNSKPKFVARGVTVVDAQTVGQEGKHLRMLVQHGTSAIRKVIGFSFGPWHAKLSKGDTVDLVFEVDVNEWNGNRELQLKLADLNITKDT
jgi:single-stranded-DNA-specific exonuclease